MYTKKNERMVLMNIKEARTLLGIFNEIQSLRSLSEEEEYLFNALKELEKPYLPFHKPFDDMDKYEQEIAFELHKQHPTYSLNQAKQALEDYFYVLKKIGWNDSPKEIAEYLYENIKDGVTPEAWMEHIIKIDCIPPIPHFSSDEDE